MQRAIAVELTLDATVMEAFDKADEEDDFNAVDEGSRSEIMNVAEVIDQVLRDHKFMVVFHNGSGDCIDLGSFGLPSFRRYFMLWTFRKRFQGRERCSEIKDKVKNTHLFAYETDYYITRNKILFPVLQKEAAAIAAHYPCMREIDPERIVHCCLYGLFLYLCLPKHLENEWAARASVYWMCDGIIQGDQAWEISAALSKEIKWDLQPSLQDERFKNKYFDGQKFYPWITITASHNINPETLQDIRSKNAEASSYFLAPERSSDITLVLSDGLFDQWNNLQVLQLSYCDFSFASPPFIGCQNLRFIGLDHCKDKKEGCKQSDLRKWQFLHSLLVLDLIDTIWYQVFSEDMADLFVNLRELNMLFVDKNKSPGRLSVHAVIVDARIARSLCGLISNMPYDVDMNIHVTSSTVYSEVQSEVTYKDSISQLSDHVNMQQQDLISAGQYHDVQLSMVGDVPMQSFPLPPTTMLSRHIEIAQGSHNLESELDADSPITTLAHLAKRKVESLHVHDLSTITPLPGGGWDYLERCRIERCPKIETVFPKDAWDFNRLETAWHLRLRSCPRLQFVLPVWVSSFPNLETFNVIHCSNLHNIFVLDDGYYPEQITVKGVAFPKLTTIHLHDLPMLRQICDVEFKMVAPALETIKIRGCWGLRRLPTVVAADGPKPAVEIEKDVWDALEWDGVEANHHPSLFQAPVHSRYYRKKLPRGSVLSGDSIKQMKASCFCTKVH
uniref:Disease resistance protein At4g27190-like leucine-rich repeats domain-containing protein n=1 Tax=Oryza barthii TaxID=65489 RepID=A0A0D3FW05_9ORYZ